MSSWAGSSTARALTSAGPSWGMPSASPARSPRPSSPQAFLEAYEAAAAAGADAVVSVHISSTCQAQSGSASLAAGQSPIPVVLSTPARWVWRWAMRCCPRRGCAPGAGRHDGCRDCGTRARAATVIFYVDTLEHLRRRWPDRSGLGTARLGAGHQAAAGLTDGHINPSRRCERLSALSRLEELSLDAVDAAGARGVDIAVTTLTPGRPAIWPTGCARRSLPRRPSSWWSWARSWVPMSARARSQSPSAAAGCRPGLSMSESWGVVVSAAFAGSYRFQPATIIARTVTADLGKFGETRRDEMRAGSSDCDGRGRWAADVSRGTCPPCGSVS